MLESAIFKRNQNVADAHNFYYLMPAAITTQTQVASCKLCSERHSITAFLCFFDEMSLSHFHFFSPICLFVSMVM